MSHYYSQEHQIILDFYKDKNITDVLADILQEGKTMKNYDLIIIGFGKAGKTLAAHAASHGQKVAVVEQSTKMYGGTCINI